jgi:type II secretory pathway component GspD/PulD (secretin)
MIRRRKIGRYLAILLFAVFISGGLGVSKALADDATTNGPGRFMSRSLRKISPDEAKKTLEGLKIATVSSLPDSNTVLLTASSDNIRRAGELLRIIDSQEKYVIKPIGKTADYQDYIKTEIIEREVDGISIGSFLSPPVLSELGEVIIDEFNGSILVACPADKYDAIVVAVEKIKSGLVIGRTGQNETATEPNGVNDVLEVGTVTEITLPDVNAAASGAKGDDELFGDLVSKLEQLETKAQTVEEEQEVSEKVETPAVMQTPDMSKMMEMVEKMTAEKPAVEPAEPKEVSKDEKGGEKVSDLPVEVSRSERYSPEPVDISEEKVTLDIPEKIEIIDLLRLMGEYLDLDYLYDPAKVKGTVTLKLRRTKIAVSELYPLVESVMQFHGFVMSRKGNLVTIRPSAEVAQVDPLIIKDGDGKVQIGDIVVTRFFDLQHVDPVNVKNLLGQLKYGITITPISDTGTLIVTGYARRMADIEDMVALIDVPGETKKFRYRQLQYTMAGTLAPQIKSLVEQMGDISITIAAPTAAPKPATSRGRTTARKPAPTPASAKPSVEKDSVYLDADERTNRILMIGRDDQLVVVEELVDSLDVEKQDLRTLRAYEIMYVGAEEVREKLAELAVITDTSSNGRGRDSRSTSSRRSPSSTKGAPTPATQTTSDEEPLTEEPQVVVVESTNTLLVNATAEQHAQIAIIISYVDNETERASIPYVIYPLENQDPEILSATLNQLIQETVESKSADKDAKITTTTQKIGKFDDDITIVPDVDTYSLIVYASKKNQQWISALIEELDEYRPLVLLDCTLVEVSKDDSFKYDLDIITKTYGGATTQDGGVGQKANFSNGIFTDARSTSGLGKAFYNSANVQAFLEVVEKKSYGRVMAKPKILVNDNQEGEIKTETTTSVAQVKSQTQIPETGKPITSTDVSFNEYKEGITLTIKPHISKGDMLRLEITLNRTDFDPQDDVIINDGGTQQTYPSPPDLLSTDITTVSTVPDGATIILGGLESIDQKKSNTKVPILGDIPLIGGLFRGIDNSGEQNKLYIFVRASIIRPGDQLGGMEDIQNVSGRNRKAFEKLEKEFQEARSWPGVKAEPMAPLRVLDED